MIHKSVKGSISVVLAKYFGPVGVGNILTKRIQPIKSNALKYYRVCFASVLRYILDTQKYCEMIAQITCNDSAFFMSLTRRLPLNRSSVVSVCNVILVGLLMVFLQPFEFISDIISLFYFRVCTHI